MMNVLMQDKLENLLLTRWTEFIDHRKLLAAVLEAARNTDMPTVPGPPVEESAQLRMSSFRLAEDGLVATADFRVPAERGTAVGAAELLLSPSGVVFRKVVGVLIK